MDEILIEEKRYISSKQAAKITGYAKDYIGQLCREGRVPARLVGRSWYVLESAISDHRFGNAVVEPEEKSVPEPHVLLPLSSQLEAPRYESHVEEVLPSINQLRETSTIVTEASIDEKSEGEPLQDSWRAWFERTSGDEIVVESPRVDEIMAQSEEVLEEEAITEDVEVNVPVRAIHHSLYQPSTDEEELPRVTKSYREETIQGEEVAEIIVPRRTYKSFTGSIQAAGVMFAALAVLVAVMGTGYFDNYVLSNRQVSLVAGVSYYNK
jgi:hypothetical protein